MRIIKKLLFCICFLIFSFSLQNGYAQKPILPYVRWGNIALEKVKNKYPNVQVVNYLHVSHVAGPRTSTE
ncbi:DUF3889 domain-containing protein [Heyndrickxia sporothermodurans]